MKSPPPVAYLIKKVGKKDKILKYDHSIGVLGGLERSPITFTQKNGKGSCEIRLADSMNPCCNRAVTYSPREIQLAVILIW